MLYIVQDDEGKAYVNLDLTVMPQHLNTKISKDRLLWAIKNKNNSAASNWFRNHGNFREGISTAIWIDPQSVYAVREFDVYAGFDKNGDGQLDINSTGDARESYRRIKLVIVKVNLEADNSTENTEETPGTPLLLNDDNDNQNTYSATVGDHRQCEPIWDLDEVGVNASEDDLMKVTLTILPVDIPGNVVVKIPSGMSYVRLWPSPSKGLAGDEIIVPTNGKIYSVASLPQDLYIEGMSLGNAEMILSYQESQSTNADKLSIDVVTIEENQGGVRKIINQYDTDITFEVKPSSLSGNYVYQWDLDGNGVKNSGIWESGSSRSKTVKYGPNSSGSGNIQLSRIPDNRRKVYNISVEMTGGFILTKSINVALDQYIGTPLTTSSTPQSRDAEIQTIFPAWNNSYPITFDNTGAELGRMEQSQVQQLYGSQSYTVRTLNDNNRIFYALNQSSKIAATLRTGCVKDGINYGEHRGILIYGVFFSNIPWTYNFTTEAIALIAQHESIHCNQFTKAKTNNPQDNIYYLLDHNYVDDWFLPNSFNKEAFFLESETHLYELNDVNIDFYHYTGGNDEFEVFKDKYDNARDEYDSFDKNSELEMKARIFLQDLYNSIPFENMKRASYKHYIHPPE